jgi:hypothetical protein
MRNGVKIAIEKIGGDEPAAIRKLAGMFDPPISPEAVYKFRRQGWWPLERARTISEKLDLPLADLVKDDVRAALLAN